MDDEDDLVLVGWGLRANPDAACEWYLSPRVDPTVKPNTGSNEPPQPPWIPVYAKRADLPHS